MDLPLRLRETRKRAGFLDDRAHTVNTEQFSLALGEFAKEVGVGKERHILLILGKAGWHTGGEVELPEGMHLEFSYPLVHRSYNRRRGYGRYNQ